MLLTKIYLPVETEKSRSGSSLIGKILSEMPSSYYVFEPFRLIQNALKFVSVNGEQELEVIQKEWIEKLLNCNLNETIFNRTFIEPILRSEVNRKFVKANYLSSGITNPWVNDLDRVEAVVKNEQIKCLESKFLILKLIRVGKFEQFWSWVKNYSNIKIIHLLRDPRARKNSHNGLSNLQVLTPSEACRIPIENLQFCRNLFKRDPSFSQHYFEFIFEKFAQNPVPYMNIMLRKAAYFPLFFYSKLCFYGFS